MDDAEYAAKLEKAHEALLTTLRASRSPWVQWVYRNAKAYYATLKEEVKG